MPSRKTLFLFLLGTACLFFSGCGTHNVYFNEFLTSMKAADFKKIKLPLNGIRHLRIYTAFLPALPGYDFHILRFKRDAGEYGQPLSVEFELEDNLVNYERLSACGARFFSRALKEHLSGTGLPPFTVTPITDFNNSWQVPFCTQDKRKGDVFLPWVEQDQDEGGILNVILTISFYSGDSSPVYWHGTPRELHYATGSIATADNQTLAKFQAKLPGLQERYRQMEHRPVYAAYPLSAPCSCAVVRAPLGMESSTAFVDELERLALREKVLEDFHVQIFTFWPPGKTLQKGTRSFSPGVENELADLTGKMVHFAGEALAGVPEELTLPVLGGLHPLLLRRGAYRIVLGGHALYYTPAGGSGPKSQLPRKGQLGLKVLRDLGNLLDQRVSQGKKGINGAYWQDMLRGVTMNMAEYLVSYFGRK